MPCPASGQASEQTDAMQCKAMSCTRSSLPGSRSLRECSVASSAQSGDPSMNRVGCDLTQPLSGFGCELRGQVAISAPGSERGREAFSPRRDADAPLAAVTVGFAEDRRSRASKRLATITADWNGQTDGWVMMASPCGSWGPRILGYKPSLSAMRVGRPPLFRRKRGDTPFFSRRKHHSRSLTPV